MSELNRLIGDQIRLIRRNKGLNQDQVADMVAEKTGQVGYNKSRISKIEKGNDNITLETLEKIMDALDVTPYEFFDFQKYQDIMEFKDKKMIIEAHKYMLMERQLDEVQYVVRTAKDFLETVDSKNPKRNNNK